MTKLIPWREALHPRNPFGEFTHSMTSDAPVTRSGLPSHLSRADMMLPLDEQLGKLLTLKSKASAAGDHALVASITNEELAVRMRHSQANLFKARPVAPWDIAKDGRRGRDGDGDGKLNEKKNTIRDSRSFKSNAERIFMERNPEVTSFTWQEVKSVKWFDGSTGFRGRAIVTSEGYRPASVTATWSPTQQLMVRSGGFIVKAAKKRDGDGDGFVNDAKNKRVAPVKRVGGVKRVAPKAPPKKKAGATTAEAKRIVAEIRGGRDTGSRQRRFKEEVMGVLGMKPQRKPAPRAGDAMSARLGRMGAKAPADGRMGEGTAARLAGRPKSPFKDNRGPKTIEEQRRLLNGEVKNSRGQWEDVGHYTQVIWRDTTQVGCALVTVASGEDEILVCRYLDGGNVTGQKTY